MALGDDGVAEVAEPITMLHVFGVTFAALGFKGADQPVEFAHRAPIRGRQVRLNLARALNEHLEVVDAAEQIEGELVARRYDDLPVEDAALTEALLGPLGRGILVRDPEAAAVAARATQGEREQELAALRTDQTSSRSGSRPGVFAS